MKILAPTMAVAALLALTACENDRRLGADFGNAVEHNKALHIINPAPAYQAPETPDYDGTRSGSAVGRYKSGTVVQPKNLSTN